MEEILPNYWNWKCLFFRNLWTVNFRFIAVNAIISRVSQSNGVQTSVIGESFCRSPHLKSRMNGSNRDLKDLQRFFVEESAEAIEAEGEVGGEVEARSVMELHCCSQIRNKAITMPRNQFSYQGNVRYVIRSLGLLFN